MNSLILMAVTPRHREDKEFFTLNLQCTKNLGHRDRRELTFGLTPLDELCALAQGQPTGKGGVLLKVPSYVPVGISLPGDGSSS